MVINDSVSQKCGLEDIIQNGQVDITISHDSLGVDKDHLNVF